MLKYTKGLMIMTDGDLAGSAAATRLKGTLGDWAAIVTLPDGKDT